MSRTVQRKRSLYEQGWVDGRTGRFFRWKGHAQIEQYREGYEKGRLERQVARTEQKRKDRKENSSGFLATLAFVCSEMFR
ncbi:TPA: hypothetical protein L4G30_005049 [Pseudomonas aeruginosa]|nr:hypothetical protein [Pseudomonas aeruginosa]